MSWIPSLELGIARGFTGGGSIARGEGIGQGSAGDPLVLDFETGSGRSIPGTGGTVRLNPYEGGESATATHTPTGRTVEPPVPTDAVAAVSSAVPDVPGLPTIVVLVGLVLAALLALSSFARGAGQGVTS